MNKLLTVKIPTNIFLQDEIK